MKNVNRCMCRIFCAPRNIGENIKKELTTFLHLSHETATSGGSGWCSSYDKLLMINVTFQLATSRNILYTFLCMPL